MTSRCHTPRAVAVARKVMPEVQWLAVGVEDAGPPARIRRTRVQEIAKRALVQAARVVVTDGRLSRAAAVAEVLILVAIVAAPWPYGCAIDVARYALAAVLLAAVACWAFGVARARWRAAAAGRSGAGAARPSRSSRCCSARSVAPVFTVEAAAAPRRHVRRDRLLERARARRRRGAPAGRRGARHLRRPGRLRRRAVVARPGAHLRAEPRRT